MSRLTSRPTAAPFAPDGLDHQDENRVSQPDYLSRLRALTEGARGLLDPDQKKLRGCLRCGVYRLRNRTHVDFRQRGEGETRTTSVSGLMLCRNHWVCPSCGSAHRQDVAEELSAQVAWWRAQGGTVAMLTLTPGHFAGVSLADVMAAVTNGWNGMADGSAWKRLLAKLGIAHWVRAIHVTHGSAGWHPHIHLICFLAPGATPSEAAVDLLIARWIKKVGEVAGRRLVPRMQAQHWAEIEDATYVCRMQIDEPDSNSRSRSPWQIARSAVAGCAADRALWREFGAAMERVRFHAVSKKLPRLERAAASDAEATLASRDGATAQSAAVVYDSPAADPQASHVCSRAERPGEAARGTAGIGGSVRELPRDAGAPRGDVLASFRPVARAVPSIHLASIPADIWDAVARTPGAVADLRRRANVGGLTALAEGIALRVCGRDGDAPPARAVAWVLANITPTCRRGGSANDGERLADLIADF